MTPVLSQIRNGHVLVVLEDASHKQTTVLLDSSLQRVFEGEFGEAVRKSRSADVLSSKSAKKTKDA